MAELGAFDEPGPEYGTGDLVDAPATSSGDSAAAQDPPPMRYPTLDRFVDEFLLEILWTDVDVNDKVWCPQWWEHAAAIVRLEALWRSFEALRQDPALGISTWLRDHADYHMGVLTNPNGPFKGCDSRRGHDAQRHRKIPSLPAPKGMFEAGD